MILFVFNFVGTLIIVVELHFFFIILWIMVLKLSWLNYVVVVEVECGLITYSLRPKL